MTRTPLALAILAAAALAGCNQEDQTIVAGPGDNGATSANANVQLPPAIAASKIYRCSGDNSVVYVDWLADNKTANVRTEEGGRATQVVAPEPGQPLAAPSGLSVEGDAKGTSIKVTLPGAGAKTCKA